MSQNELYHFGILGQKWGVRRYENPDGTLTEAGKKRYRKEHDVRYMSATKRRDAIAGMTDQELQAAVNRQRNEQALNNMINDTYHQGTKGISREGNQFVNDVIKKPAYKAAGKWVENIISNMLGYAGASITSKNFDVDDFYKETFKTNAINKKNSGGVSKEDVEEIIKEMLEDR